MKRWIKSFFAVDNNVNEQTVVGVFWTIFSTVAIVLHIVGVRNTELELILTMQGASLLCFGISGFKRM